ncbi:MAG: nucleotide sugar dehydrogenase [Ilumatobacteraceae bacterium]
MNAHPDALVVIGLGYVGLPLAVAAAARGYRTVGLDTNAAVVERLNAGRSHVDDISDAQLAEALGNGFRATTDATAIASAATVVICVPTPLDEHQAPDLDAVRAAAAATASHLTLGALVVLESTTYPGTTDGPVREILETSGLVAGREFALAFSPERIDPGNHTYTLTNTPKVVGGYTTACGDRAEAFYGRIVDEVVRTAGCREAELAKLLENTYRHVNIALVNEMAVFSHELGIDLWDAIRAASSKPFGFEAFYPGPGVGGHCIPIDPNYLSYQVRRLGYPFRFVELAQEVSGRMPAYVVARAQSMLNGVSKSVRGSTITVLGLTYKANVADERETPARPIIRRLLDLGAKVVAVDPYVRTFDVDGVVLDVAADADEACARCDLALVLQGHRQFDLDAVARRAALVLDTRGSMSGANVERL